MMIDCHTAHAMHRSLEQHKYGQVHGHSYMLAVTQSWRRSAFSLGYIVLWDDFISDLVLTYVRGMSFFQEEDLGCVDEVFDAVLPEVVCVPYEVLTHVGGLFHFLEFGRDWSVPCTNEAWHDKSPWFCSTFSPGNIATVIRRQEIWVCQLALNEVLVSIMKILDGLHTSSSWLISGTEHVHIMVSLLSMRISLALHILVSALEKVTVSPARLWDPGIFQVGFHANLQLLACYWVPYNFVFVVPWVGSSTRDGVSLGIYGLDGAFIFFGVVHSWRQKAFSHQCNIIQSLNFMMEKWSPWNYSGLVPVSDGMVLATAIFLEVISCSCFNMLIREVGRPPLCIHLVL